MSEIGATRPAEADLKSFLFATVIPLVSEGKDRSVRFSNEKRRPLNRIPSDYRYIAGGGGRTRDIDLGKVALFH